MFSKLHPKQKCHSPSNGLVIFILTSADWLLNTNYLLVTFKMGLDHYNWYESVKLGRRLSPFKGNTTLKFAVFTDISNMLIISII